jgi:hypothetical protein
MLPSPKSALPCLAKTSKHGGHWIDTTQLFSENLIVTSGPMRSGFSEAFDARVLSTLEDLYGIAGGKSDKDLHDLYVDNWCRRNLEHTKKTSSNSGDSIRCHLAILLTLRGSFCGFQQYTSMADQAGSLVSYHSHRYKNW